MRQETERGAGIVERGAATVLVVGSCALLVVLAFAVLALTSVARGVAQARSAADLSALAAAGALRDSMGLGGDGLPAARGSIDPCAVAASVAAANGAQLRSCTLDAGVNVMVAVDVPVTAGGLAGLLTGAVLSDGSLSGGSVSGGSASATARAGPAPLSGHRNPEGRGNVPAP